MDLAISQLLPLSPAELGLIRAGVALEIPLPPGQLETAGTVVAAGERAGEGEGRGHAVEHGEKGREC